MKRREAAAKTGAVLAICWLFAWLLERWPAATLATVSTASIYRTFRMQDNGPSDGSTHGA